MGVKTAASCVSSLTSCVWAICTTWDHMTIMSSFPNPTRGTTPTSRFQSLQPTLPVRNSCTDNMQIPKPTIQKDNQFLSAVTSVQEVCASIGWLGRDPCCLGFPYALNQAGPKQSVWLGFFVFGMFPLGVVRGLWGWWEAGFGGKTEDGS